MILRRGGFARPVAFRFEGLSFSEYRINLYEDSQVVEYDRAFDGESKCAYIVRSVPVKSPQIIST